MTTLYRDVWEGLGGPALTYDLLIASPPCQTFSMAGNGTGRRALDEVLEAITAGAYRDPAALRTFGTRHDMRTALVLTPLSHVWRDRPELVVLEQVPAVLPVWEAYADVMRGWGYSVALGVLNAEQYGVPQTRRRAILTASLSGTVALPVPTHSRYYSRDPERLDAGVLPWVSMAEALGGRGLIDRPSPTITGGGTETGGAEPIAKIARYTGAPGWVGSTARLSTAEAAALQSYPGAVFTQNNKLAHQARRPLTHPAPTITAGHDSGNRGFLMDGVLRAATPAEVSALQSYPDFVWCGSKTKQFLQIGNAVPPVLAAAVLSAAVGSRLAVAA
jgi:DNA (cytosine-5)-methyltransferase 1